MTKNSNRHCRRGRGFTLIELVITISVIAILSAVALPRYIALQTQARVAKMQAIYGGMRSASSLAHAMAVATNATAAANVSMEGTLVTQVNGYPTADAAGIITALQLGATNDDVTISAGAAAAALGGLGLLVGGGTHVEPVSTDTLKPLVPAQFAGLRQNGGTNTERGGLPGFMVATAKARYSDESGKSASLEITDTGGASGLMGLASWASIQQEKEDDNGSERTLKVDGRLVHEKTSKRGGSNEFGLVLGERFLVSASGVGVDLKDLRSAVTSLDLAKLESLKDVGVTK